MEGKEALEMEELQQRSKSVASVNQARMRADEFDIQVLLCICSIQCKARTKTWMQACIIRRFQGMKIVGQHSRGGGLGGGGEGGIGDGGAATKIKECSQC